MAQAPPPPPPHIAIVTTPGMGLFIPMIELAKHLLNHPHGGFHVTCIIPTASASAAITESMKSAIPSSINQIFLPPVDLPKDAHAGTLLTLSITLSLPHIKKVLTELSQTTRLVALFGDVFSIAAFDLAPELNNLQTYMFFSSTMEMSWLLHASNLDSYTDSSSGSVHLPGCIPIPVSDMPGNTGSENKSMDVYKLLIETSQRLRGGSTKGIVVNAFLELQPAVLQLELPAGFPPIYPIGPLVRKHDGGTESESSECLTLRWLDQQPRGSVLFVSFGSGGTLTKAQTNELALGLEMSGLRFLWVVRSPNDEFASAAYMGTEKPKSPSDFLPVGFTDRIRQKDGRGLLVSSWAPQPEILSHGSVGGFLTHCGWSSILESIVNGVPLIAWPLFAEQGMNAVMLTDDLKVAVRPKANDDGLVEKEEVAKVVKALMEGDEGKRMQERMMQLKGKAEKAVQEGGSSDKAFSQLALELLNN